MSNSFSGGSVALDVAQVAPSHGLFIPSSRGVVIDTMDDDEVENQLDSACTSTREIIAKEAAGLAELHRRFSVRDIARKFEKGQAEAQAAVEKISGEVRVREAASLDQQVLLQKLREVLEALLGRVAGRNKDDVEEALTSVDALSSKLAQRESELAEEKLEVRRLAALFKQASDDAKWMVEEARAAAKVEIESARAATRRIEEGLEEQERLFGGISQQELDDMRRELQDARRIKMLHESSKAMDMEHEVEGLRQQLAQKTQELKSLQKEMEAMRLPEEEKGKLFRVEGMETLGACLEVSVLDGSSNISQCSFQWYRVSAEGNKVELISGATKPQYAPEPFDVGRYLRVEITSPNNHKFMASSQFVIDPAPGLGNYVESLVRRGGAEFQVIMIAQNGVMVRKPSVHGLSIGHIRIKLRKGRNIKAKESYSASMQLCGVRGGGIAAAQGLFWQAKKGLSFILSFESARERNAAIMLARRFAFDCNIMLAGPDDRAPLGT
ncbi:hypothetical protein KP509_11G073700 [Ceratopteris richardii]|uniref:Stomatal closure-related actin-binding protein 1 n=1 Tax=Ceratopteris richardii TaxID=49495 RepID=A0A8T2TTW1_CERRI|nr:hypothetical protein KP509_11G073700 [Ceratopteris richardii]KAH7425849.1 hypothetical protein KP509_11G073700 [Ceratopteris richardii]KAH7425850.1 hypothetical protein KP509_11G073700 [Ceratopteris richardii]